MQQWLVGIDLGGTTIKMAFVTTSGDIVHKWEIPTNISNRGEHIVADIARSLDETLVKLNATKEQLLAIGIGAPGPVQEETGTLYEAINLGWTNYPLKQQLEAATMLPVAVDNDANIAALGEMWKGAGGGARHLLFVTLGTGVGGGVISNGTIVRGTNGAGGELGHMTMVVDGGAPCNCGKTGCLETIASATGIVRITNEKLAADEQPSVLRGGEVTAKAVFDAAKAGDPLALQIVDEVTHYLGLALANAANVTNPEKIVIGGGVSKAGDILVEHVTTHFRRFAFPRVAAGAEIALATLGNDAGVIGGAWLAKALAGA
ncbi:MULTISPECIES: ROK family glucokinase [Geobacillus]|jgi:glucokinase|uniref:Glucokinase n=1 Tax=Geobacillus thermodenitrificans TaxID=33940 RepID=A0ABY9Q8W6_GEOTD|nr:MULTISPECIES: ROK family glucokinase [Geobacillus]ARA99087.1 glucokinase [Geobacillus thermodenitrificans]ARP43472.1 Glucokinase [Geobacillus thermodenitrificans]ATO38451.1 glucokinase [Geobacillus thermodenitrificans]MEC5187393.1 glucokinase [Geobacillus thermodenitrificans]MED0662528.1 glucokinase [Geobacillus thermodenitrificans]